MVLLLRASCFLCFVFLFFTLAAGICNITGTWKNDLGSILKLSTDEELLIRGSFQTAVETSRGSAGWKKMSKVIGVQNADEEPTFAFSVRWDGGSVSTWAGQCFESSDTSVLKTVWLLRSSVSSKEKNWKATRVGEDVFYLVKKQ
ncbi:avidin-related protein 4/5-like [Rhinatrema bivittatum]|uniref:avidin-related protein 4/5-like n=1 Tax=Rhinatrema bivittatum TaxID=194408 RepID=UPI001128A503|nr:avidin-related protein 4/5-like [Rhinatrema bivittatum]